MRIVRSASASFFLLVFAARALAQVSCANPDNLCTGDPCVVTNVEVQSPCTVDFGARALRIAGVLRVPDGGSLSLTAATIVQQGPIDGRHTGNGTGTGASITLVASAGDLESRGEIDVAGTAATGSIDLQATGNILVKDNLIAKPAGSNITAVGGTVTLDAGGTIATDQTAVVDVKGGDGSGGVVSMSGDGGVTVGGRVIAEGNPGGSIGVGSAALVTLDRDLRVLSAAGAGGLVVVSGDGGVVVNDKIRAGSETTVGGTVQVTSANGDVDIRDTVDAGGATGGAITVSAPNGTVAPVARLLARGGAGTGGAIDIAAATITLRKDLEVRSKSGNGGSVTLTATTLLDMFGGDAEAAGKVDGGSITLQGGAGSGDVTIFRSSSLNASGRLGSGGSLTIAVPAGALTMEAKADVDGPLGGAEVDVSGSSLTITRTRIDGDGKAGGADMRFDQTGTGLFRLDGTFEGRTGGTIEAQSAGDLTATGRFRVGAGGCVGFSAVGTLVTTGASSDVPITPSCP
jgi:hypothetical protein